MPRETAAVSAHVLCTQYNLAPDYDVDFFEATYLTDINTVKWLHKNSFVQAFNIVTWFHKDSLVQGL